MDSSYKPVDMPCIEFLIDEGPVDWIEGYTADELITTLVDAIEIRNAGALRCREFSLAITHLQEAQNWLSRRTRDRQARGVDGSDQS